MKILLVIPRYNLTNEVSYRYAFPLGLAYISSAIKQAGYDIDCLNLNHKKGTIKEIVSKQLDKGYDIVCSGHTGIGYAVIEKIVQATREHTSKPKVILGGALITSEPELILNALKPDFEVLGEGERTIVELLSAIKNNKNSKEVNGIGYIENGKSVFTQPREQIEDLDLIPLPDFDGFGFDEYLDNMSSDVLYGELDNPRAYPLLASRGCPFSCSFCFHCLGKGYRERKIKDVIKELKIAIEKYNINSIEIYDDLFSINRERLFEFCKELKDLNCKWTCQLSVLNLDKELLQTLKNSGCNTVSFGFESYSQEVLRSMRKPITPEKINNAIKLCMEVKMGIQGNFIFGDTAETKQTAKETLDYWKENTKGQILIGFIQPYPGSEIYKRCLKKGIIKDKLDFIKNKINHTNWYNMTDSMTDEEVLQLKKDILDARRKYAYYLLPEKIEKIDNQQYNLHKICPFCDKEQIFKNCFIKNKKYYVKVRQCRDCHMRFFLVSRLYKFTMDYYQQLDFFRRVYLSIRDKVLKRRI